MEREQELQNTRTQVILKTCALFKRTTSRETTTLFQNKNFSLMNFFQEKILYFGWRLTDFFLPGPGISLNGPANKLFNSITFDSSLMAIIAILEIL